MAVTTLSQFNQNPAAVRRMAEQGEVIVERYGRPYLRVTRISADLNPLDALVDAGLARPPTADADSIRQLPSLDLPADSAEAMYQDFLWSRARRQATAARALGYLVHDPVTDDPAGVVA